MGSMRLIGRDQHRPADRTLEFGCRTAGRQLQYVVLHPCTRCTAHHTTDYTTRLPYLSEHVLGEGGLGALGRLRADLLVVVARRHTHIWARRERRVV